MNKKDVPVVDRQKLQPLFGVLLNRQTNWFRGWIWESMCWEVVVAPAMTQNITVIPARLILAEILTYVF